MDTTYLKNEFERRKGQRLAPSRLTDEMLTALAKMFLEFNNGELNNEEETEVLDLYRFWIHKIMATQSPARRFHYLGQEKKLILGCMAQLEFLIHTEIVCRQSQVEGFSVGVQDLFRKNRLCLRTWKLPISFLSIRN